MGFGGAWHWVVILVVVVLLFGTSKLRNVGKDLGGAIHDFKKGLNEGGQEAKESNAVREDVRKDEQA